MTPATVLRLALAGTRTDTLRVALTAVSAVLATLFVLAAATVLAVEGVARQYRSNLLEEAGLRPGVAFALLLLTLPVLALAAQCGRLGAPVRDRRLAAVRLAGATPRQALALVAIETGVAVTAGTAAGFALYLAGRRALHERGADGLLALPTDVLPAPATLAAIAVGLPLIATAVAALLLRRVAVTPFGVTRRVRRKPPGAWPALLIGPALAAFAIFEPLSRLTSDAPGWLLPLLGGAAGMIGVVAGTGWLSASSGRLLHRFARRPAALLAARRLMADPWAGSRTFAALLACVVFGAGAVEMRAWIHASIAAEDIDFYVTSLDIVDAAVVVGIAIAAAGLLVALAEGIVSRRRTYAGLVAAGVPRGTLGRAILWQTVTPLVPAILLALAVGLSLVRGLATAADGAPIPTPFAGLAVVGAVALAAVLAVVGLGLLFLRSSTSLEELRTG